MRQHAANPGPLVLDIERLPVKGSAEVARHNREILARLADWARAAVPGKMVGFYGTNTLTRIPPANLGEARELARHVDALFPPAYTFNDDRTAWAARADSFTFATIPASGAISGAPGSTIGWGYKITNNSATNFVEFTALSAGAFVNGTPLLIFDFPIIAPGATATVPFNFLGGNGLYQLTLDLTAPVGLMNSGTFMVSGDFCMDSSCSTVLSSLTRSASYSATVTSPVGVVSEPDSALLVATGLCLLGRLRRHPMGARGK